MTPPPFPGNDLFGQIDSVARNLTGDAFRLKRDDPDAPQKFTEFVAQSEQEFSATQPQAAQPTQTFQDFEQGGFQQPSEADAAYLAADQYGDRRAEILARQQAQADATAAARPSQSLLSTFFGQTPMGSGLAGLGMGALEAFEQQAYGAGGAGAELFGEHVGGKTPFDIAFREARDSGMSMTDAFEVAREYSKQFDIGDEKTGYHGVPGFLSALGGTLRGDLGTTGPYVREGGTRKPMFTVGLADLTSEIVNPQTLLPGVGELGLISKGARVATRGARTAVGAAKGAKGAAGDVIPAVRRELDRLGNPPRVSLEDVADASTLPPRRPRTSEVREGLIEYTRDEFIPIDDPRVAPGG